MEKFRFTLSAVLVLIFIAGLMTVGQAAEM